MENTRSGRRSSRRTDSLKEKYATLFFKEDNCLLTAETRYFNFIRVGETVEKAIDGILYHPKVLQLHCKISYSLFLFINMVLGRYELIIRFSSEKISRKGRTDGLYFIFVFKIISK